jgi:hypothetical protein
LSHLIDICCIVHVLWVDQQSFCTEPPNLVMQDKLVRMWDRLWCFDARFFCLWQNIRVMAKYYTRITLTRMAELLDLPVEVSVCQLSGWAYPWIPYLVVWKLENCGMAPIIWDVGMCRMQPFLAVFRSFFRSSLLCTFFCHPSPPTIRPSSLTSSYHLFLGLPLNLVVPKFVYNTLLGILFFFSILCTFPNQHNLFKIKYIHLSNTSINTSKKLPLVDAF